MVAQLRTYMNQPFPRLFYFVIIPRFDSLIAMVTDYKIVPAERDHYLGIDDYHKIMQKIEMLIENEV